MAQNDMEVAGIATLVSEIERMTLWMGPLLGTEQRPFGPPACQCNN
jgi:hypothetical protein